MRFSKPLAAAGILGLTLLTGTALTGAAYADSPRPAPRPTATAPAHPRDAYAVRTARNTVPAAPDTAKLITPSVRITVSPGRVKRGGSYTVRIVARGVGQDAEATVTGPDGRTSTVTVGNDRASKTLRLPRDVKPGTHTVTVEVDGVSATATLTVTR
jgi:hypothetical protein